MISSPDSLNELQMRYGRVDVTQGKVASRMQMRVQNLQEESLLSVHQAVSVDRLFQKFLRRDLKKFFPNEGMLPLLLLVLLLAMRNNALLSDPMPR